MFPERSEGLLFHQASDFHRMLTTTEIAQHRRQNGSLLRSLSSKSAFGTLFSHQKLTQIRRYKSRNRFGKKLGLCYLATLKAKFLILDNKSELRSGVSPRVKSSSFFTLHFQSLPSPMTVLGLFFFKGSSEEQGCASHDLYVW